MKAGFQLIFHVRIPRLCYIRLRPKVFRIIASAKLQGNEVINFVLMRFIRGDAVFRKDGLFRRVRDESLVSGMKCLLAQRVRSNRCGPARGECHRVGDGSGRSLVAAADTVDHTATEAGRNPGGDISSLTVLQKNKMKGKRFRLFTMRIRLPDFADHERVFLTIPSLSELFCRGGACPSRRQPNGFGTTLKPAAKQNKIQCR